MNILKNRLLPITLFCVTSTVIVYSAVDKFFFSAEKTAVFANTSFEEHIILLGVCDLFLLAFFLLRWTRRIGFVFSVCYYSAALSLRVSVGASLIEPLTILVLLFTTMLLSDPTFFFHWQSKE
jgi:hypothetical protein